MKLAKLIPLILNLFVFSLFSVNLFAAPGDLDTTFGTGGILETSLGVIDTDVDMTLQADGKILVLANLASAANSVDHDFAFIRFNSDGSPDMSFGTNGKVILAETGNQIAGGIAIQSDGKIVAVGTEATNLLVYRLNANGTPDTSFGKNGKLLPNIGGQSVGKDVVIQPDGKIVIAGQYTPFTSPRVAAFRLNSDGTMDTSFNSTGFNWFVTSYATIGNAIALQNDGKIIVGGNRYNSTNGFWLRINGNGSLDGATGSSITTIRINEITIQPDAKILFTGSTSVTEPISDFAAERYKPDKTVDSSFGFGGRCNVNWSMIRRDKAASLIVEPNGNIVVGGNSLSNGATKASLVRFNAYGALDFSFGNNGKIVTDYDDLSKLVRQPDGKILALGRVNRAQSETNLIVARYVSGSGTVPYHPKFDFDGDSKADVAVFRPSTGYWYILQSSDNNYVSLNWGLSTDQVAPADYDGDGKTDIAVLRGNQWYILKSSDNTFMTEARIPISGNAIPADFEGDGIDDTAITFGSNSWQYAPTTFFYSMSQFSFGVSTAKRFTADFDGDLKSDFAAFNPSTGNWQIRYSTAIADSVTNFGISTDLPVPADYDGDGKADIAVYRPEIGDWYWLNSFDGSFTGVHWGANGDKPVPADYDGDGKTDIAVFRPSDGTWYILQSTAGFKAVNWGLSTDSPIPNVYIR